MQAAPPLLSFLLILLYHSGWTHGLCMMENSTVARCDKLEDLKNVEMYQLEILTAPVAEEVLTPGLFNNLTSLRHLDMSSGDLKKIEPGSFRTLSNLKSLNLGDNRIEYLELASLEGLTHLRSLNLRKNAIRQLPPALARLKNLKHLDIHGNPLECNCATLKVRDLITLRGVTVSKKVVCTGPGNMRGTSLMKPNATTVCIFEQQDREMQNDQAEGSGTDLGSGDGLDEFSEEDEDEYVVVGNGSSEKPKEPEVETPFPTVSADSTTESSVIESTVSPKESIISIEETTSATTSFLQRSTEDEEIFFDSEEKKEQMTTTEMSQKKFFKDGLFYPPAGDGDDGSGEGSGAIGAHYDEEETKKEDADQDSSFFTGTNLLDYLFGGFTGSTAASSDPDLEEEQFIDVSSTKLATEEPIVPSKIHPVEADIDKITTDATTKVTNGVEIWKPASTDDKSKLDIKVEVDSLNDEQAEVSSAKQSKKGMGSYVVLAILLAVVAALIGFAAYRGDICRKKRKRGGDVENGTELKDMQKSLLPDAGNSIQPKVASNGNPENVPLVEGNPEGDDTKINKIHNDDYQTQEAPRSLNGTADHPDPVKPPRKLIGSQDDQKSEERPRVDVNSLRENFLAGKTSPTQPPESPIATNNGPMTHVTEPNGPPLSPGAQRVKITLQEIPDSVPKTPILITRTMAGENLVKTP